MHALGSRFFLRIAVTFLVVSLAVEVQAAPAISNLSLRGLKIGEATTVTVTGRDLLPAPRIVLPVAISKQTVLPGATAVSVKIEVVLEKSTPVGIYPLRLANAKGISNALAVGIDQLVQQPFTARPAKLPIALHGKINGSQILKATFTGKKGQAIIADVESRRLGSNLQPVVRLYDPQGRQFAWSGPKATISGDARCGAVLPSDGQYTLELHDMLYRGSGFFRLKLGPVHYADLIYPLGVQQGRRSALTPVSSNMPKGTRVEVEASNESVGYHPAPLDSPALTGSAPPLAISWHVEAIETTASKTRQSLGAAPAAVSGRISQSGEEDQFVLDVTPGQKLRIEVWARRLGSPLDGLLSVRGEQGNQLAANDDRPGNSDPGVDYTVPENVKKIVLALRDVNGQGGEGYVYRIAVSDVSRGDFQLTLDNDRINIPLGGTQIVRVQVKRLGFNGPVKLTVDGLLEGVRLGGDEIPAGVNVGLLSLTAQGKGPAAGLVRIVGVSNGPAQIVRDAQVAETSVSRRQPWLRSQVGLAVTEASPISVSWSPGSETSLVLGSRLPTKVKVNRTAAAVGDVRLRLLTTQVVPKKTVRQGNQNKQVDDPERTLRLDGKTQFATGAEEVDANLFIPADLSEKNVALAIAAELLSADKKRVLATTYSPVNSLAAREALKIELKSSKSIEARAGAGPTGKFTGKVIRTAGFTGPVTLTIEGFRPGYPPPKVVVPAGQEQFEVPIRFPFGARLAELNGVRLVATLAADPKKSQPTIRARAVVVNVKVVEGTKPAAGK